MRARPQPKVFGRSERAVQESLEAQRREARNSPFVGGQLIEAVEFPATTTVTVRHSLGYKPKRVMAFLGLGSGLTAPLSEIEDGRTDAEVQVRNNGSVATTADLWVK